MRTILPLLKLSAAATILAASLFTAPAARAVTCVDSCNYQYNQCLTVWQFPKFECDLDLRYCLRKC